MTPFFGELDEKARRVREKKGAEMRGLQDQDDE